MWAQDVVGKLDNMRMEHLACLGQRAQIRGIVLSDDGILRERLQEDGVDDDSCFTAKMMDAFGLGPRLACTTTTCKT